MGLRCPLQCSFARSKGKPLSRKDIQEGPGQPDGPKQIGMILPLKNRRYSEARSAFRKADDVR